MRQQARVQDIQQPLPGPYVWGLRLVELMLVFICAYLTASVAARFLDTRPAVPDTLAAVTRLYGQANGQQDAPLSDASQYLTSFDAFYRADAPVVAASTKAPESSLQIKIFGLRANGDGGGTAIIKVQGEKQKLARPGDEIASGVRLVAVYPDRLEVNRRGVRESVTVEIPKGRQITATGKKPSGAVTVPSDTKSSPANKAAIRTLIDALDLRPVKDGKRLAGFAVGTNANAQILAFSGLQQQDLIISVNGHSLINHERLTELVQEVSGTEVLSIMLNRKGAAQTLNVPLAGLI